MTLNQNSVEVKITSPTLHLYHYVLRNGINESSKIIKERRDFFENNLNKIASHLTSKTGKEDSDIVKLVSQEKEHYGNILDFTNVPDKYRKSNNDKLYFETGIIHSRLAARRLNDNYFLRLIRYVSSGKDKQSKDKQSKDKQSKDKQSLEIFGNICEHLNDLEIELGQTVILAGIIAPESSSQPLEYIAKKCLSYYKTVPVNQIITNEFLGSPFYIFPQKITKKIADNLEYKIESTELVCVFLYKDEKTEQQADSVYKILQNLLLSYHKINFFYSQSLILKEIISKQYEKIERLTEDYSQCEWDSPALLKLPQKSLDYYKDYSQREWDRPSLLKLPQESLDYYKRLSFLEDQARLVEVHLSNYRESLEQIEQETGQKLPAFLADFEKQSEIYLEQMKSNIGFLSPGIPLYEKLMLSVQTQVSISENEIKDRQAKLGQLLTGVASTVAIGQIVSQPMTSTLSLYFDKDKNQPSVTSLWFGALLTVALSLIVGYAISIKVYQWFTKDKF